VAPPPRLTRVRARWLVNLLLVAVVAALAAYALLGRDADDGRVPIVGVASSVVQRIAIEPEGMEPIELAREGDNWFVTRPLRARANSTQVERLLDLLAVRAGAPMPATDLQRFDLNRPSLRVRFDDTTIAFGTLNPLTQQQYVLVGDRVFMIPGHHRASVPERVERVLTHALLRKDEKPVSFQLPQLSVERLDGRWTRRPDPDPGAASQDDFHRWVDEWRFASSLLTQRADRALPAQRIVVAFEDGRRVEFGIVQREPELVLVRGDESLVFHFPRDTGERLLAGPALQAPTSAAAGAPSAAPAGSR